MAVRVNKDQRKGNEKEIKQQYRILNWKEYNQALINRGSLSIWLDESVVSEWYNQEKNGKKGANNYYSDRAISCGLIIREVFHLALRQLQGFMSSLINLMGFPIECPNYTTFCRRQKGLSIPLPRQQSGEVLHVVVDSTGLKVYGEGEWKVRKHGYSKRRTWRKLHLAIDAATHEVLSMELTSNDCGDNEVFGDLINPIDEVIEQISADGAYDTWEAHRIAQEKGARLVAPPQENAVLKDPEFHQWETPLRDDYIRENQEMGRAEWKIKEGYHPRSLAETAMFRIKCIFGNKLKNRNFSHQQTEALMKCVAMNIMTQLGMPLSYQVL